MTSLFRFNVFSFGLSATEDEAGMLQSKKLIEQVITDEVNSGTPSERIFLGGFSQGGAMALLVGLTGERKFAAVAILSSWLPLRKNFKAVCDRGLLMLSTQYLSQLVCRWHPHMPLQCPYFGAMEHTMV